VTALLAAALITGPVRAQSPAEAEAFHAAIARMAAATAAVADATFTMHRQEYVRGELMPAEQMAVRYRPPHDVCMTWTGDVHQGRVLLFRPGWNDDDLWVRPEPWMPALDLDPRGTLATRGERHTIHRMGWHNLVPLFQADVALAEARRELAAVEDMGMVMLHGEPAHCWRVVSRKDLEPRLYGTELEICVDPNNHLMRQATVRDVEDGALRMVEKYGFSNITVNPGLTDADFTPVECGL